MQPFNYYCLPYSYNGDAWLAHCELDSRGKAWQVSKRVPIQQRYQWWWLWHYEQPVPVYSRNNRNIQAAYKHCFCKLILHAKITIQYQTAVVSSPPPPTTHTTTHTHGNRAIHSWWMDLMFSQHVATPADVWSLARRIWLEWVGLATQSQRGLLWIVTLRVSWVSSESWGGMTWVGLWVQCPPSWP